MSLETIGYYDDRPGSQKYPPPIGRCIHRKAISSGSSATWRLAILFARWWTPFGKASPFMRRAALPEAIARIGDSDHASFWHEGYPAIMVTDTANFRCPFYHTQDTIDKVNFDRLARVVRGLEKVVTEFIGWT